MTYCSLAKELMEIKKFNTPIKIFNFYSTITMATTQPFQIFSLSNISKLNQNQNTNSNHNLKTNQIRIKNEKKKKKQQQQHNKNKANLTHLSRCGEEDEWWWRGRVIHQQSLFVRERKKERESSGILYSLDKMVREKKERERERETKRELWYVLEFAGSGREKKGKKEKNKRERVRVWRRKKRGKKIKKRRNRMDEKK